MIYTFPTGDYKPPWGTILEKYKRHLLRILDSTWNNLPPLPRLRVILLRFQRIYTPIRLEYGWSAAAVSGAISFSRLEGGIEGPFVGYLIPRFGARKILGLGVFLTGLGYILMIYVDTIWALYLVYGGVLSVDYNMGFTHSLSTLINNWFIKKRARAMSIYALAAGVGGAIIVPLLSKSIQLYGWRSTAIYSGLTFCIIGFPQYLSSRTTPRTWGYCLTVIPLYFWAKIRKQVWSQRAS
ncbi:MFS transporter [Candidatus Bathyarchaeota archaeon]|nr:MFS transporter [Candidatus Bathyarchaeota archaeon]